MGMIYQDQRHYEDKGSWLQRYEYMLTAEGLKYSESISNSYKLERKIIEDHIKFERHQIPYDLVSILLERYLR